MDAAPRKSKRGVPNADKEEKAIAHHEYSRYKNKVASFHAHGSCGNK